jgi:Skp family chaperone for outer membrane proteins
MSLKRILFIIFISLISLNVNSSENISFVDIDFLFENSTLGKSISKKLNNLNTTNIDYLKLKENKLVLQENEISKIKNVISKDELEKKISAFKKEIQLFDSEKKNIINDFNKKKTSELEFFFKKINPIIQAFMNENSVDILMDKKNIFIGKSTHDITNNILSIINEKIIINE